MVTRPSRTTRTAAEFLPERLSLTALAEAVQHCRGCDLYKRATQAVFGEGPKQAKLLLVGEQPGDQEDLEGRPFVGPAGRLLDELLEEAQLSREEVFVTNAVKHFKWTPRGKRRLHSKPTAREMTACRPWLEAELAVVEPRLIVCMGATAAQSLLGASFRLTKHRGEIQRADGRPPMMATYHPSAILRAPDSTARAELREAFVDDLRTARSFLRGRQSKPR